MFSLEFGIARILQAIQKGPYYVHTFYVLADGLNPNSSDLALRMQ